MKKPTLRQCEQGHRYSKSSDCPVCPVCESQKKSTSAFGAYLSAPACRALESLGVQTLEDLQDFTPQQLLQAHGFGPSGFKIIEKLMREQGLNFKE